jgi:hypothetical protein
LGSVIFAEIAQISFSVDEVGSLRPQADCGFHVGPPLPRVVPDEVPHSPGFERYKRKIQDGKIRERTIRERTISLPLAIRRHRCCVQAGLSHAEYNTSEPV